MLINHFVQECQHLLIGLFSCLHHIAGGSGGSLVQIFQHGDALPQRGGSLHDLVDFLHHIRSGYFLILHRGYPFTAPAMKPFSKYFWT